MIFRDLTAFERADEQDRLRERLAALGQMAAGLAHEIRNPLAGIEVLAGLLKRRLGDRPEEQALVAELLGELRDVADTVTASLDFVRPLELARAPAEAVEIVEAALRLARSRVAFAGSVERDYDPDLPRIRCDADRLRALVTDLIVNAFEAMAGAEPRRPGRLRLALRSAVTHGPRRAVRVSADGSARPVAEAPARELVLEVADDGPGVAPEIRDKIFYPFFTTRERGSGVGLATAQKIAASHGGVLELDCPEAGGALFRLRLPLDGESP
jgi:nitrogen-specific signal transduction histidine kinase